MPAPETVPPPHFRHAVLGQPAGHSLSPFIHSQFAQAAGLAAEVEYLALDVAPGELVPTLARLYAEGYAGLNLTLPHKLAGLAAAREASEPATRAGAANTLVRVADGWRAENTDGAGFMADLARLQVAVGGRRVLILGAGGAARGLLAPLLGAAPARLVISNRNPWKPEELAAEFKPLGELVPRTHMALKGDQFDVVINATSAGHQGLMVRLPGRVLAPDGVVYDLSYGRAHAPVGPWAAQQGAAASHVYDGLGMLVAQAAEAWRLWHGWLPEIAPVLAELRARAG